jgi:hypothetical protein
MPLIKAQLAGNGYSLGKNCNTEQRHSIKKIGRYVFVLRLRYQDLL